MPVSIDRFNRRGGALYRRAELSQIEATAVGHAPPGELMRRAGQAVAQLAAQCAATGGGPIVVLAGPGNNGGDALVAATVLIDAGMSVSVHMLEPAERYSGDARDAFHHWQIAANARGVPVSHGTLDDTLLGRAAAVIDGLYGIGLNRAPGERATQWILQVNQWTRATGRPIIAVDIPSGLLADSGAVPGVAVRANHTVTMLALKPGLFTGDGPDHAGAIKLDSLDVVPVSVAHGELICPLNFAAQIVARPRNSNKGDFGSVAVCGGAATMSGAVFLAGRSALYAGAGRVYLELLDGTGLGYDPVHPELMLRESLDGLHLAACVVGPGLGQTSRAKELLVRHIARDVALVLDADALNLIATDALLAVSVRARQRPTIITPHPLEAARLLACSVADLQSDRIAHTQALAKHLGCVALVKGVGSVVADAAQRWAINTTGNAGLASGGTGDVLAGLIGALLAQGWEPFAAAAGAAWMHGAAADRLVASGVGPVGMTASELAPAIRATLNSLAHDIAD
jgi:ADP-dependent NAD(P)H-hydrate dehydratase / NAD(P)H-hydrate epimerase